MNENDLKTRTKQFGLRIIKLVEAFPKKQSALYKEADEIVAILTVSVNTA